MSEAGKRSSQGDEYQIRIATSWLIRLLEDDLLDFIQAEAMSLPGDDQAVTVDDVVVVSRSGRKRFIQAKKNQAEHQTWKLSDKTLQAELCKARDQLEGTPDSVVEFCSRSPFGQLKKVAEDCRTIFSEYPLLVSSAPATVKTPLAIISGIIDRPEETTHQLVKRIEFASTLEFEELDRFNLRALDRLVTQPETARNILERYICSHQGGFRNSKLTISRNDVEAELFKHKLVIAPPYSEAEIMEQFKQASTIGRQFQRTIAGEKIERTEKDQLVSFVEEGYGSILVTDRPGCGKTCLLLDLIDHVEDSTPWGGLFIKGDQFSGFHSENELVDHGMPEDIVGKCARLAAYRKVVVIIDSLDVLALNREHGTLQLFLSLADRLEGLKNVTVVAACRIFDLDYDPLLRDRQWGKKLQISGLDFDEVICPLLKKWGVDVSALPEELKTALEIPQSLRLFAAVYDKVEPHLLHSSFHIQEAFIEEILVKNPLLGEAALTALQGMASRLVQNRTQSIPRAAFKASNTIVQRLISQEILVTQGAASLSLSHQTLLDVLIVRDALERELGFVGFVLRYPPFPFVRPFVRAYLFYLRSHCPEEFNKQVWQLLTSSEVAYHLRRLVAESLSEIVPIEKDWSLIRRMFQQEKDLFLRFWYRISDKRWFSFLVTYWLPIILNGPGNEGYRLSFIGKLRVWTNYFPGEVVSFWIQALTDNWCDKGQISREVRVALDKFEHWEISGIRELLDILVEDSDKEKDFLGKAVSRFVQQTNAGDDLLWKYICKNVKDEDVVTYRMDGKLRCEPHDFINKDFLQNRLACSAELLSIAIETLIKWSEVKRNYYSASGFTSVFLNNSSWHRTHSQHDMYSLHSHECLLNGIEAALKSHSKENSDWWKSNEPILRESRELTFQYFLLEAYKQNIQENIAGIEQTLISAGLFRDSNLRYELGLLMQATYPHISSQTQEHNQKTIMALYAGEDSEEGTPEWRSEKIYQLLIWIPSIFRTVETQVFIEQWQGQFGPELPGPDIRSWGGTVVSPISTENMLGLTDHGLLKLLIHYQEFDSWERRQALEMTGGREQVSSVFRDCCSNNPERFLALTNMLVAEGLDYFLPAVLGGIATHLNYRFGYLQKQQGWQPVEPLPDGESLSICLIELIERYPFIQNDGYAVADALKACSHVLEDSGWLDRLVFLMFPLVWHPNPEEQKQYIFNNDKDGINEDDLAHIALNSVRGEVAEAAAILCNRVLNRNAQMPELLPHLLRHFSRDSVAAVRVSILRHLPYIAAKDHDLGWMLFQDIFREAQDFLWRHGEQFLYYQYHSAFERVWPYLDRIRTEAPEVAGGSWGRIATLSCLSGLRDFEDLFRDLREIDSKSCWKGAVQVLTANLNKHEHRKGCEECLLEILKDEDLAIQILSKAESAFGDDNVKPFISEEFALAFIRVFNAEGGRRDLFHFLEWISFVASANPLRVLCIIDALATKLESFDPPFELWHTEPLISTLIAILKEADETDDPELIGQAIELQDRYLKLNLNDFESAFDQIH